MTNFFIIFIIKNKIILILMSDYDKLESDIKELDNISSWNQKVNKIKEIKEEIKKEEEKLDEYMKQLNNDELIKTTSKSSIDKLLKQFENSDNLEDKINIYNMINYKIKSIESELFF